MIRAGAIPWQANLSSSERWTEASLIELSLISKRDVTSDRRILAQTPMAASDNLADPVQDAVGQIAIGVIGGSEASQLGWRRLDDHQARQIIDLLREKVTKLGGNGDRIGEQVIDRRQAGAGRMSPCGHLDRSRLAGEYLKSIAFTVAGQVNQNVDLVGPDAIGQPVVGPLESVSPSIGNLPERSPSPNPPLESRNSR